MPAPQRNRWLETWEAVKERKAAMRDGLRQWSEAVKAEPELIWQTPAVRYTVYGIGALITILILRTAMNMLQPVDVSRFQPRAKTAHFDVICSNPDCGRHFVIQRRFKFHKFPVTCAYCSQLAGQRALRCASDSCSGRLAMTIERDKQLHCVKCGAMVGRRR